MPAGTEQYKELWGASQQVSTPEAADGFFAALARDSAAGGLSPDDASALAEQALRTAMQATAGDPGAARAIILRHLLPLCLTDAEGVGRDDRYTAYRLRELLRDWIEQYPDERRAPLRREVLRHLLPPAAGAVPSKAALLTVSRIGFRSPEVEEALRELSAREDGAGDAAVRCWAALGPPEPQHGRLVAQVLNRLHGRDPSAFDSAIQALADPEFLPALEGRMTAPGHQNLVVFGLLGRIADSRPGDGDLQHQVWSVVERYASAGDDRRREVTFWGSGLVRCDAAAVVRSVLNGLALGDDKARWTAYHRLDDFARPRQLEGWAAAAVGHTPALIAALERDATRPSGLTTPSPSRTMEHHLKEYGWHTALSAGVTEASAWVERAVVDEANPYAQYTAMDAAACLAVDPLPDAVLRLVRERLDVPRGGDDPTFLARIAAAEVCRSAATAAGFDALLNCGFTLAGHPLRSTAEAVGEVAAALSSRGEVWVSDRLLDACAQADPPHRRQLAVSGVAGLAGRGLLPRSAAVPVTKLAGDATLPAFARARLVWALGRVAATGPVPEAAPLLLSLAGAADVDEELRYRSLEALTRLGPWGHHEDLFASALDLTRAGGSFRPAAPERYRPWQGYLLAQLVREAPERFATAAADVVLKGTADVAHQLTLALDAGRATGAPSAPATPVAPDGLAAAIVERIRGSQGRRLADTSTFGILARLAPGRYVETKWEDDWNGWMPNARAALADGLQVAAGAAGEGGRRRALRLLEDLASDSSYAVRRSAARAFSRVDARALARLCGEWGRSGQTDLRRRAAEAAGWLPFDNDDTLDNETLRQLSTDPEPAVRSAAGAATVEARERAWAAHCLDRVNAARSDDGTRWVLSAFRYGQALSRLGDDEAIERLADLAGGADPPPPPNVRHWLGRALKAVEKHWKKSVQEWPEPWLPWSGSLEEVDGTVSLAGATRPTRPTRLSLWLRRRRDPADAAGWGGAFPWDEHGGAFKAFFGGTLDSPIRIEIPGRRPAEGLFSSTLSTNLIAFVGTGPYPDPAVE